MFATLLESGASRARREGWISVSTLLHIGLTTGGVLLTTQPRVADTADVPRDTIVFVDPGPRSPSQRREPSGGGGMPSVPIPNPTIVIPNELSLGGDQLSIDTFPSSAITGLAGGDSHTGTPSGNDIFAATTVEKPALPLPGNKPPVYPEMLRTAGIEGSALMQFIIDTTGSVEPLSISTRQSDHDLFTSAVRAALLRHRFLPAEVGGHKVRMLVEQRFDFAIQRD